MEKTINLASMEQCTGCATCVDICTKACITMQCNGSIHAYPVINYNTCVACGLCMKTCPALTPIVSQKSEQKYYMAWHIDDSERMTSTSGGAGAALVSKALSEGWYVCGAAMDEHFQLQHIISNDAEVAKCLKGSKYLQSDMIGKYNEIKQLAIHGNHVLFIGTPCQVEGLNHFLPDYAKKNVLTCGIICHGVNSPLVWKDYKTWLENRYKSSLEQYNFRSKSHGWQKKAGSYNLRVYFKLKNGKTVDEPAWKNLFHSWFGNHYIIRRACINCSYRNEYRNSDITIGDFWNVERLNNMADTYKGVSVVITSTDRGDDYVQACSKLVSEQVNGERAKRLLKGYVEHRTMEQRQSELNREIAFESEYINKGFEKMRMKYPAQTFVKKITFSIKSKIGLE